MEWGHGLVSKVRTGDLKLIQELNRSIILNMIRAHGPISRSEIAKRNRISPTTVASAVQDLMKEGFVYEVGEGASSGGRKPIMVKLAPDSRYLIGVSVTNTLIEIAHLNLEADIYRKVEKPIRDIYGDDLVALLLEQIDGFISDCPEKDRCIGISIIVPGVVDAETGVLSYNSKLRFRNANLKSIIEERFHIRTWIENDMNALVLAEKKLGRYGQYKNMIYVSISDGVGSGIFFNDILLRGSGGGAGEFGHTSMDRNGIKCECGNSGCLENYISWPAIYSRVLTAITRKRETAINDLAGGDLNRIDPGLFHSALRLGDPLAVEIIEDTAAYLGAGLVNLVNLFNPEIILIGGTVADDNELLLDKTRQYVLTHALPVLRERLDIRFSSLGENARLLAAGSIILQDIFHFSLSNEL